MAAGRTDDHTRSVREAMDRVLAAEREAQQQIEACSLEKEAILAAAREQEQRIRDITDRRIDRVNTASQRATAARIRELRRESAEQIAHIDHKPGNTTVIARAAAELALRLTSRDTGDQPL